MTAKTDQATTESSAKTMTPAQSDDQTTAQAQTKTEDQASVDAKTDASDSTKTQPNADKQTATESKTDQASEDQAAKTNNDQATSTKKAAADDNASTTAKDQSTTTDQTAVKNEENNDAKANDNKTTNLSLTKGSVLKAQAAKASLVQTKAATNDEDTITVNTAQELIDAIQKGTATTINIGKNIDLGEKTSSQYTNTNISNKRNIIIQSADGKHYTVDFNGYGFNMYSNDYGVTFKDLDLYGRSYFGIVRSAGSYTFDNVNYTGSQLIYTDSGYNTTVNFDGNVTAHSVGSYTSPLNNKSQVSQGGNTQQVIQFAAGTNTINFNSGSNVTLTTTNSNVLEVDKGTTTINVKNGAQVSLNPHTQNGPEQLNGMSMDSIARGIASNGDTTLNIDQGGNLDINLTKNTEDKYLSGALYLNSGATINVNGNLNINSDGTPYYRSQGWDDPVYINGNAIINVNGGSFKANATKMGDYKGSVVTSNGNSTIAINHHGTFDVTGDGTQATGVSLGSGSTFTSTQPELFNISMPDGATAIKNGKVQFKGVKTSADGQPIGEIDITYASDGTPTVTKVTSYDEAATTATRTAGNNAKNKINLVAAGEEVNLSNVSFVKNADGTYTMSGNANTADNKGAYVYVSVNGTVHQVAPTDSQTLWTAGETGDPTSSQVPYTAETGTDGKFTVNLGKLKDTDQVSVYGAKDFVTSDTDTKTVSDWMTSSYRDQLQKLVDEAPTVEAGSNFTNATDNLKTTYTSAISDGSTLLQNSSATSEQLEAAANAITTAKTALNGDLNKVKQDLQAAVDAAPGFENTSATYYNATPAKQKAYTDAISAGSDALKAQNPTVESLTDALNKINDAKAALDGQPTNKQDLQAAVNNSKDVKDSNNYTNADQAAKTAYDDAVTAAQSVLDNKNATQAQVTQALQDLNTANGKLNGDAKTDAANRQALEDAVKDAPNVRNTPAYYNGDSKVQDAYNKAITDGQAVLDNKDATPAEVKNALDAITNAKKALDGQPTNKDALQDAVNKSKGIKDSNNYANADQNEKTAYDNAVTAAQGVLDNENATQAQVNQALKDLNTANSKLNGDAKTDAANRVALEEAVKEAPVVEKTYSKYYNGTEKAQNDYKNAVSEGQKVLDNPSATAAQIKTALDNINAAKDALDGDPTDKTTLQNGVDNAVDLDKSNADAQAKKAYTDALDKAKQVLADPNATQQAVKEANTALTNAKTALDNSSALQNAKDALQQAVDAKSTTEKTPAYYNANSDKQQAYNTAISAGTDALKVQNPTVESLTTALNKINEAKNALDGKATDTSKLKAAVDNANTVKASNDYKDASADYQKQYDDAVKAGQQLLDPTTAPSPLTQADVDRAAKAITDAQSALTTSATTNVKDAKEKATADLTTAVDAAKKAIDQDTNLTEDERNAAKAQVDQDASAAKEAINKATTNNAVTSAATAGKVTIDKTVANAAIDNAAAGKNKAIDGSSLTDEEKNGIKDQVAQAVKNAKGEISAADTEQKVTTAQKNGVDEINGIKVPSTSTQKDEAKGNINKAADDAKKEIDQDSNLTDDQKQAAKNQIDSDAKNAQKAIDDAKTDTDVNNAINGGKLAIDKTAANAAIDNAAAGKNKEIANSPLTTDEQNKLHDQVAKEVKTAKDNINSATIPTEVTTAKDNGVKAINGVKIPTTSPEKDKAKENLDKQVQDAKDAIDKDDNLTDDQKQAAKDQIDTDAKNAQDAIDNAKNDADVNNAADNGKLAIDKTVADAAIDNAVAGKIKDVKAPLTTDEQKTLTDLIKETGENAKQNIASATTPAEVTTAQENGVKAINDINVPTSSSVKDNATAAIDKANTAAKTAKDNINKATTNDAVKDAENNGVDSIKGITFTNLDDAKKAANNAIDNALTNKTNEINNASNLSQNEKQDLISKATDAATTAKDNIAKATTNDAVTDAQNKGIEAIANITVPSLDETKQKAINAIKQVQESKNKQISDAKNLNADQQKSLTDQVNKIADDAIAQINDSSVTTNDSVATICDNAIDQITNLFIPTLDGAQKDATNAIETAKNAKIDEINNAQNLSDQEKQDLTDQVNQAADDATKAIKDATTNDAVKDAETKGLNDINNIKVPSLAEKQQEAKNAVAKAADAKNQAIDNSNLTSDEKTALKKQVSAAQAAANKAIDDASTDAGVTKAQNDGIDNINKIAIPETSDAKAKATTDLKDAVDNAKKAIDQDTNLTNDQKQAAKDAIDQDTKTAQEAINNANTDSDVKKATDNGQLAIDKDVANAAIDNAAAGKKAEIAKSPLTDAEKQALDQQVDQQVQTAKSNIAKATTTDEVTTAQNNGIDNINNIKIPSVPTTNLTDAKNAANTAIDNAAAAKKNAIKAAQDAGTITAEQATDLNQQVDRAANEAKQAINNATTVSQVEQAQTSGIQTINNINIPSITDAKDAAKNAIDQAAKNKDAEIDASNLSDQEKADLKNEVKVIADTAKKSIDSVDNAAEVNNAMNAGIAAINSIKVATSSDNQNGQSGNNGSTIDNGSGEATNNNGSQAGSVTGATTSQSNGAKVSATGLNVKNNVRINVNKQAAQLPQTGNQTNTSLGVVGLAAASLACLFGFTKLGKKKED